MSHRSLFRVLTSPVRFFEARAGESPSWTPAMAPVLTHGALASAAAVIAAGKGRAALAPALAGFGVDTGGNDALLGIGLVFGALFAFVFTWFLFALQAGAAVVLDVVFAGSGRARRLVEFTGYAYLPSVLWAAASLMALAVWWSPAPLRVPSTLPMSDLPQVIADYQRLLASTPLQIALRTIGMFVGLWLVALQCAALRVVSGFTVLGAVASGIVMGGLLVVLPWAWWN